MVFEEKSNMLCLATEKGAFKYMFDGQPSWHTQLWKCSSLHIVCK